MSDKKFGLIIPQKPEKLKRISKSIFDDESEEDEKKSKRPKIPQKKINTKNKIKQESLEDPSIYEYDSIYDDMKAKQAESIAPKEKKNSRYIDTLLKAADKRKKEYERRIDKKIQAEREKEGDMYKDKEAFVTSAYKKKLQEKEEEEERERRENMLNDMMDVSKQKDLSGFYRHFLNQTTGEEKVPVFGERYIKQEVVSDSEISKNNMDVDHSAIDHDSNGVENNGSDDNKSSSGEDVDLKYKSQKNESLSSKPESSRKKYKSSNQDPRKTSEVSKNEKNIDQDSDGIEIDSDSDNNNSSSGEEISHLKHSSSVQKDSDKKKVNLKHKASKNKFLSDKSGYSPIRHKSSTQNVSKSSDSDSSDNEDVLESKSSHINKLGSKEIKIPRKRHDSQSSSSDSESNKKSELKEQPVIKKNDNRKANIYAKRTVGDLFAAAQARYFQRMASRSK